MRLYISSVLEEEVLQNPRAQPNVGGLFDKVVFHQMSAIGILQATLQSVLYYRLSSNAYRVRVNRSVVVRLYERRHRTCTA